jgi:hypothetical protein
MGGSCLEPVRLASCPNLFLPVQSKQQKQAGPAYAAPCIRLTHHIALDVVQEPEPGRVGGVRAKGEPAPREEGPGVAAVG